MFKHWWKQSSEGEDYQSIFAVQNHFISYEYFLLRCVKEIQWIINWFITGFLDSWISTEFGCIAKSIFFPPRIKIKIQRLKPWDQHFPERHGNWKQLKGEHLCGSTVSRIHLLANFSRVHSRGLAQHYFTVYMMGKNFLMIFLVPSYLPNDKKAQTSYLPSLEHMTSPKRHVLCLPVIL